jgi:peptidoglycan/LPS O-acetylase OafA/YrhL
LIGYYLLSEFQKHQHIDLKRFYFRRALRLLPGYYAGLIVFSVLIGKNVGTVWANLVYVNNFLPYSKQCMEWAWSLAIEEQFYICLPLLLPLILKSPARPLVILFSAFVASFLIQYAVINHYGLSLPVPIHPLLNAQGFWQYFDVAYDKIYMRYGALLIGVVCAYLYLHTKLVEQLNRGLRPLLLVTGGFLAMAAGVLMLVLTGIPKWPITAAHWLLASCHNVFSLGAGLICLFVLTKKGAQSLMGRFLSARFFYAIAQVSYGAYLLHLTLILVLYKYLLAGFEPSDSKIASFFVFYEVVTLTGATLMYVFIERPFIKLRSLLKEVR